MNRNEIDELGKFCKRLVICIFIFLCCDLIFVIFFKTKFMLSYIPTESMENTILAGDFIFGMRTDVEADDLKRYDILSFIPPDSPDAIYIKRLIGLPGETIRIESGRVFADGIELDDSFVLEAEDDSGDGVYEIPEGCYFFLGDNRDNSEDSRFWEEKYVPLGNIHAKAKRIIFPFSHAGSLEYDE